MKCTTHPDLARYPDLERHRNAVLGLLERVGTPVFLGERDNLIDRFRALDRSLETHWPRHIIGYSFKTNYLVAESGIFGNLGAWAEVVSGHEYRLACRLGFSGSSIIFNGPCKPDADLGAAITGGVLVNVNDHDELDRMLGLAGSAEKPVEIGLRLSSTMPGLGHSRFGFSMENGEAETAVAKIRSCPRVVLVALHTHLYGDTDDPDLYGLAASRLGDFAKRWIPDYRETLKFIDMGGGFPAHSPKPRSRGSWNPRPIDVYVRSMADALRPFFAAAASKPTLIVEPGRYLTGDGILLATRVIHVKARGGKQIVNCDGSISMVPLTHYRPQIIRVYSGDLVERTGHPTPTVIQGCTCRENDLLYEGPFPVTGPGDYLIHFAAGAYNSSLSPDFIFRSPSLELF